jgi:preprotein translocase subunit YajC
MLDVQTPLVLATGILAAGGGSMMTQLLPIVAMFAVIYFIVLRPMSKQEKERRKRVEGLKKGDHVVLGGGILGRISNADDDKIAVVEIADRVKIRVLKKDIVDTKDAALKAEEEKEGKKPSDKDKDKSADKDKSEAKRA